MEVNQLGRLLAEYIKHNNITPNYFADSSIAKNKNLNNQNTLSHTAIKNIINNETKKISLDSLDFIANAIEISRDDLLMLIGYSLPKGTNVLKFKNLSQKLNIPLDILLDISGCTLEMLSKKENEPIDLRKFMLENKFTYKGYELNINDNEDILDAIDLIVKITKREHL